MIVVVGSINIDLVVLGERIPAPGETVIGGTFYQSPGGKGANQAVAAARTGIGPVSLVGAVGADLYGDVLLSELGGNGVGTDFVRRLPDVATGVALILVDSQGENCISVASGANTCVCPEWIDELPASVFAESRVLVTNFEIPLPAIAQALRLAKAGGLTTIVNAAPARSLDECEPLLAQIDVLLVNQGELADLAVMAVVSQADIESAARMLRHRGVGSVVVTRGPAGAVVVGEEVTSIPGLPVTATDTTGAGDTFAGALAAALNLGESLTNAGRFATVAAGLSVTRQGAQGAIPNREAVLRHLAQLPS